jgi:hypothetical protein
MSFLVATSLTRHRGHDAIMPDRLAGPDAGNDLAQDPSGEPGESGDPGEPLAAEPRSRRRARRRWLVAAALAIALAGFGFETAQLFVWPRQGMPARVDAIVMLNGPGGRLDTALNLAWAHRARVVVISRGSHYWGHGSICAPKIPGVTFICFDPSPPTTRGEAEFAGRLARRYDWHSIALVAITPQITPAELRLRRCFGGKIYAVHAPLPLSAWPGAVAYEWGATINAVFLQPGC